MTKPLRALLLSLLVGGAPAVAQGDVNITVQVGKTARVDVQQAAGLNCDDPSVVSARLVTSADGKRNTLVLTGKAPGRTFCRAGQPALGYTVLVHITVEEAN